MGKALENAESKLCCREGWGPTLTPTGFHRLLSNFRLFFAFRFGDHHGRERSDKAVVE